MKKNCTVLHAEPEKSLRGLFSQELQNQGFQVYSAATTHDTLRLLSGGMDFSVAIIHEVIAAKESLQQVLYVCHPEIKVILLSDKRNSYASHYNIYAQFTKPYSLSELIEAIRACTGNTSDPGQP